MQKVTGDGEVIMESMDQSSKLVKIDSESADDGRIVWSKKIESMLAFIGVCVGLGNLWRFPYLCMRNGGGAFLIPFIICLVTCGLPLIFLEMSLGQFTGKDAMHAWEICPILKGMGIGMVIVTGIFALYYNVLMAWTLFYIWNSFVSPLPWRSCGNSWNTPYCVTTRQATANESQWRNASIYSTDKSNISIDIGNHSEGNLTTLKYKYVTSEEEFWQYKALDLTSGIHEFGGIKWDIALCYLVASILVFLCIMRGVKSIGKVVYVTALMPYILLTVILVRGLFLPGSLEGIRYFIEPDFSKLGEVQVWIEAALQVFYSLCPGWGIILTMASSNKFDNNCYRDSIILTFIGEGTSVYGGFAIFSVLGFMAHEANLPVSTVVKSGPGLGFVVYPEALAQLPLPNLWAVVFFVMLTTVALDSQQLRQKQILVTSVVCVVLYILGLMLCSRAGIYVFQFIDWYVAVAIPVFALIECLIIGWIYGAERMSKDVELMIKRPLPLFMRVCWCFVTPFLAIVLFVFTMKSYQPPTYGDYVYPSYVTLIGWMIGVLPLVPVFVVAVLTVRETPGETLIQRFISSFQPSAQWKPVSGEFAKVYQSNDPGSSLGFLHRVKLNLFGESTFREKK